MNILARAEESVAEEADRTTLFQRILEGRFILSLRQEQGGDAVIHPRRLLLQRGPEMSVRSRRDIEVIFQGHVHRAGVDEIALRNLNPRQQTL